MLRMGNSGGIGKDRMRLPRSRPLGSLIFFIGLFALLFVVGCSSRDPQNWEETFGTVSTSERDLFNFIFYIGVVVFFLVEGLLIYAIFRFRHRRDSTGIPVQTHGNTTLEIVWTVIP